MKTDGLIYRIRFIENDEIKSIYARYISEENLVGFLEADELVLNDDFTDSKLSNEFAHQFKGVQRVYFPMHVILRIDEIDLNNQQENTEKSASVRSNVRRFPPDLTVK